MEKVNRRRFLKSSAVVVTSACLCGMGGMSGCATITKVGNTPAIDPASFTFSNGILNIDLEKETTLAMVGGSVKIRHTDIPEGIIIAHVEQNQFEIASLLCTHRGVEVEYDPEKKNFTCASLGSSTFTLDGDNIKGPADKPLRAYDADLNDSRLVIRL
jgi:Rieske Fe-S protein